MEVIIGSHHPARVVAKSAGWLILLYCLAFSGAYILSLSVFPAASGKDKIFDFGLSPEQSFNHGLFLNLSIGICFIALVHIIARLKAVQISIGNAILAFLLVIHIFCFVIGTHIALLHTTKLWFIEEHFSLIEVLSNLKLKGEMQLYYIMLIFTFIVPMMKMIVMAFDIFICKADGSNHLLLSLLSKWAMLDVLIVGVIISTMKSGHGFVEMRTGVGLSFFIFSILLSLIISVSLPYTRNK